MSAKSAKKVKSSGPSTIGKFYLLAYNGIQTLGYVYVIINLFNTAPPSGSLFCFRGEQVSVRLYLDQNMIRDNNRWSYMLLQTLSHFLNRGSLDTFWPLIKTTVVIFQNAAVLEVVHSLIGLVPSGVAVVLPQVYSRVFLVCGCLLATEAAPVSPGLPLCILAWSITEIIRYAYYTLNLINCVPQPLLFLRYSTFLILYPIGITGELLCMYHSLEEIDQKQLLTISMPNAWNVAFNYFYFLVFYMFLYIPIFPFLYGHMLAQRRKMLGKDAKKSK